MLPKPHAVPLQREPTAGFVEEQTVEPWGGHNTVDVGAAKVCFSFLPFRVQGEARGRPHAGLGTLVVPCCLPQIQSSFSTQSPRRPPGTSGLCSSSHQGLNSSVSLRPF